MHFRSEWFKDEPIKKIPFKKCNNKDSYNELFRSMEVFNLERLDAFMKDKNA